MKPMDLWVSSRAKDGGIYRVRYDKDGITPVFFTPAPYPSYFVREGQKLFLLCNVAMGGAESDILTSFDLEDGDILGTRGRDFQTKGISSCHLCAWKGEIYVTSYVSGNLFKTPDCYLYHTGSGPHPNQASPHPHCVCPKPDGKYLLVADLGTDRITLYTPDLREVSFASVPSGHGARHLTFMGENTLFCVNELASTVTVFFYENGKLAPVQTVSTLPKGYSGESYAGAIRASEGKIYVSNRGHNSVAQLVFSGGKLSLSALCSCGGDFPRDIYVCGENIFCANQNSDNLTLLKVKGENLSLTDASLALRCPMCILSL